MRYPRGDALQGALLYARGRLMKRMERTMAAITLLTPAQLAEREQPKGPRQTGRPRSAERTRIIEAYKAAMQDATPGQGAEVRLGAGEAKRIVRQNLKAAAAELNKVLAFRPIKDPTRIHYHFITAEAQAARPKRAGRPRKNVPTAPAPAGTASEQAHAPVPTPPAPPVKRRTRRAAPPTSYADRSRSTRPHISSCTRPPVTAERQHTCDATSQYRTSAPVPVAPNATGDGTRQG